jgi:diaminopimelate decarboxylase
LGKRAPITIRINPDVDAKTHAKITTGTSENKFGIPWSRARAAYKLAASLPSLEIVGVDTHIGSQITELSPFEAAFARVADLVKTLRTDGHSIQRIDLGGGLGVPYAPTDPEPPAPELYGAAVSRAVADLNCELILEPGRLIAANAGVLVSRVTYVKEGDAKKFLILDAGMNDLIRPAMYDAHHEIVSVREGGSSAVYDVVGPVCESSDLFGSGRRLPELKEGDLVAILTAGAYGAVMASAYNARPPAAEVLVKGDQWAVVRPRMSDDELIGLDRIPGWLAPQA